jgi:hypothetical protein
MINVSRDFLKDIGNGIYLTDKEINVLENYKIDYLNCKDTKELVFKIEDYLNDSDLELIDLENLSDRLSEYQYYNNTNK